jgi:hypothetical protein
VTPYNGTFGTSNILPESPAINDILALPGSGAFNGLFRTGLSNGLDFNNLRFHSVNTLAGFAPGTPEDYLYNSSTSGGIARWAGLLDSSDVQLNLVSISSGMSVRDAAGNTLLDTAGQSINLGAGDSIDFTPIFATSGLGNYQAVFTLTNPSGTMNGGSAWGDGGQFMFEVTAVPEPATLAMLAATGATTFAVRRWRKRRSKQTL